MMAVRPAGLTVDGWATILTRDIDIGILSVCPSVRPSVPLSVMFRYCIETA